MLSLSVLNILYIFFLQFYLETHLADFSSYTSFTGFNPVTEFTHLTLSMLCLCFGFSSGTILNNFTVFTYFTGSSDFLSGQSDLF